MATQVQSRRGTTAQHATFTGAAGEVTVDTDKKTAVVHDGVTAGGSPLAKESGSTITTPNATITGGSINNTPIGGSTPNSGAFTSLDATGDVTIADKIVHAGDTNTAIRFPAADTVTVETSGAERVRITTTGELLTGGKTTVTANGGDVQVSSGVSFPATQVAKSDPNTLDDYEEGTWTATITPATSGSITLKATGDDGAYTKVGRMVTASAMLFVDSVASPVGTDVRISLPFTTATLSLYAGRGLFAVSLRDASTNTRTALPSQFAESSTFAQVFLDASTIEADDEIQFTITYFV